MARRSVYCSKYANGKYSIARSFTTEAGNIWFEPMQHAWIGGTTTVTADDSGEPVEVRTGGRCTYCGASQHALDRGADFESHAYAFIHTDDINARMAELFGDDMQFDVIIGNPPYQTTGGGGGSNDSPIYQLFVEQAMMLEPRLLSMVIPSRFMAGGRGLGAFRADFLGDRRVRSLVDYENAKDAFPSVGIGGGICYFLWNRDNPGLCECTYHRGDLTVGPDVRQLDEFDVFVRDRRALDILRKVLAAGGPSFEDLVSGDTPFGLATNFRDYRRDAVPVEHDAKLYANVGTKRVRGSVGRDHIRKNVELIDVWKLFIPVAGSGRERERAGVDLVLGPPIIAAPGSVCTQTYLAVGPFSSEEEAASAESYLATRLVRFLISLRKPAQHVFRSMYRWVPARSWDRIWSDEDLYVDYGLTAEEVAFVESLIRPMDGTE